MIDADFVLGLFTLGSAAVGVVVWLVRLEGRINTQEELRKALSDRLGGFESRIYELLERIEHKLDQKADK